MAELKQRAFSLLRKPPAAAGDKGTLRPQDEFKGAGIDFSVKMVGKRVVSDARGEPMAQAIMKDLRQEQQSSGLHKQKVIINISLSGIKLTDEKSQALIVQHPIRTVSFITIDPDDSKWFSFIAAQKSPVDSKKIVCVIYCLKSDKQAPAITRCLMKLFKFAHRTFKKEQQRRQVEQQQQGQTGTANTILRPRDDLFPDDPNYATLSNVKQAASTMGAKRTSVSLIDFNAVQPAVLPPVPEREDLTSAYQVPRPVSTSGGDSGETADQTYSSVNVGLKDGFTMEKYGLALFPMEDPDSLPAPVGVPFSGIVEFPFVDVFTQAQSPPGGQVQVRSKDTADGGQHGPRQSMLLNFDPFSDSQDNAPRSSSFGSSDKKAPPIPPSRRDANLMSPGSALHEES